mmetsp:Transcript_73066/g.205248  ORF Transcript_73066/g.205248 Transcript_73066/m.205248 type:complete len:161 (+) Transcript_73066:435-917(+)
MPRGEKAGHSVYDEEELLGPYVDMGAEEDADGYSDDDAADGEDSDLDDQWFFLDAMSSDAEQDSPQAFDNSYVVAGVLPRLARSMKPLCCVDRLSFDLPERCPICLDGLVGGQVAWRLPCTHAFHDECTLRYFGSRNAQPLCPMCRCNVRCVAAASKPFF